MTKEELAKEARRFVCVLEGLDFKGIEHSHKDNEKNKEVSKTFEVRRGPNFIFNTSSLEEAEEKANKINTLLSPFIMEEFERLSNKLKEFNS